MRLCLCSLACITLLQHNSITCCIRLHRLASQWNFSRPRSDELMPMQRCLWLWPRRFAAWLPSDISHANEATSLSYTVSLSMENNNEARSVRATVFDTTGIVLQDELVIIIRALCPAFWNLQVLSVEVGIAHNDRLSCMKNHERNAPCRQCAHEQPCLAVPPSKLAPENHHSLEQPLFVERRHCYKLTDATHQF